MDKRAIVMVVDDAPVNLHLCKGLLDGEYDVRLAKSGKMALAALNRVRPDIILLDIEMPDMTGFEFMDEFNKNADLKGIPVVFATSHNAEKVAAKAAEHGVVDYIEKPFNAATLLGKIKAWC